MTNGQTQAEPKMTKGARLAVVKRISKYLFAHKGLVAVCFIIMLVSNLLALAAPKLSQKAIDEFSPQIVEVLMEDGTVVEKISDVIDVDMSRVLLYTSLMLVFYASSALLSYLLAVLMIRLSQKVVYSMRKELFEHLTELPVGYFDTHATGELISRMSYDIDTINTSLSHDVLQVGASIVTVIGSLIMMVSISPMLLSVFVITVPLSILYTRYRSTRVRPLFRTRSQKLGELNGYAEEMLSGQKTIRAYSREGVIGERFDAKNREAVEAYYKAEYHAATVGPTVNFINNLSLSLVAMLGGIFYLFSVLNATGAASIPVIFTISFGGISAFIQYSRKFAGPVNEFANIIHDLQSAASSAEKVFAIMDEAPEKLDAPDACVLERAEGNVDFKNVKFGYVEGKTIIKDLSLTAKKGNTIAIVGPTGAGKTTIINLLMRFYDVDSGEIRIDGTPINEMKRDTLRSLFGMVLQDTWIKNGTVRENIAMGRADASDEEIIAAAKACHAHSFIKRLPKGYDTVIKDNDGSLSQGQRQLICICRIMIAPPPLLILDEATSSIDTRTELKISDAFGKLMKGRTSFIVAHRLRTIMDADMILVMNKGNVVERGTHKELLSAGGFYARLYNSQFE